MKQNNTQPFASIGFIVCLLFANANAQITFTQVTHIGNGMDASQVTMCGDVSGRAYIADETMCAAAATSLGLSDTTVTTGSSGNQPPGCVFWGSQASLLFNTNTVSTIGCGSNYDCLCASGVPACTNYNGNTANAAACLCGSLKHVCGENSFCTSAISTCSDVKACSQTDGTAANDAECLCGVTKCTSENLFCFKSSTSGVCGAVAHATSFFKVETGTCQAVSGRGNIMSKTLCTDALENIRPYDEFLSPKLERYWQVISSKLQLNEDFLMPLYTMFYS